MQCRRCTIELPAGRTYCDMHYQEELAKYNESLEEYNREMMSYQYRLDEWNDLSEEERADRHTQAEEMVLKRYGAFNVAVLSISVGLLSGSWVASILTGLAVSGLLFKLGYQALGRVSRALAFGFGSFLMALVVLAIAGIFIEAIVRYLGPLSVVLLVLSIGICSYREWRGDFHASGAPKPPHKPVRPKP